MSVSVGRVAAASAYALLIVLAGVTCSSSTSAPPVAPTPPANLAATWTGTIAFSTSTGPSTQTFSMTLNQLSGLVSGVWQANGGGFEEHGGVSGTVTPTAFSGIFAMTLTIVSTGAQCNSSAAVQGPVGGGTMTWTSTGFALGCADPPTNVTIAVTRQ